MTLDELALLHNTDKASSGHHYTRVYETYLWKWRTYPANVLELGVAGGGSLRMWREYFVHPDTRVIGVDVDTSRAGDMRAGIELVKADQMEYRPPAGMMFDLIVDDGGHYTEQQITSFANLWPNVKPGSLYVIEDVQTSYSDEYKRGWPSVISHMSNAIETMNCGGERYYARECNSEVAFVHYWPYMIVVGKANKRGVQ